MIQEIRMLRALHEVEGNVGAGLDVHYALQQAAEWGAVPRGELAELMLEKTIGCARARAAVTSIQEADTEIDAGEHTAIEPRQHVVPGRRRAATA